MPKEVKLVHHKRLKSRLDQLTSAMTSLTKRLMGKGAGQAIEYKEESVHNVLTAAQNAIVSIAKEVKDNFLHVMTTLVIMLLSAIPQTPAAKPPRALLMAPNALVIK